MLSVSQTSGHSQPTRTITVVGEIADPHIFSRHLCTVLSILILYVYAAKQVMARSDNVVRVALTPKHRDVPLLCEILTYHMGAPPIVQPELVDDFCARYSPPIKDFEMMDIQVGGHK